MILKIYKNNYGFHLKIRILKTNITIKINKDYKLAYTTGIRNNTQDGKRILFIDYDNNKIDHLIEEIKYLQIKYELSDIYILKSSQKKHSYHAICLDKHNYKEFRNIIEETSCDNYYKNMPVINDQKTWVLRTTKKNGSKTPKLIRIIKSPFNKRKKSLAHYLFLKNHYQLKIKKPLNLDKNKIVYNIVYGTLNYFDEKTKKYKTKNED